MKQIDICYHSTPAGDMIIGALDGNICLSDWKDRRKRPKIDARITKGNNAEYTEVTSTTPLSENTQLLEKTCREITEYFDKKRESFDIPIILTGTDFQKSVWQELMNISYGKTDSYIGLSRQLNNEKAFRAVATASSDNALSILIPCHRLIGADGSLIGYAGGKEAKHRLLALEGYFETEQIDLFK